LQESARGLQLALHIRFPASIEECNMSRFFDTAREASRKQSSVAVDRSPVEWKRVPRPFQVVTVTSNKGGVGKTTIAANLAIYVKALRPDLPVLILGLDDQATIDRMFALGEETPRETVTTALRAGDFAPAVQLGEYGVHYVPTASNIGEIKREIWNPFHLQTVLRRTNWRGLIIIDTKSDLEILTQNAIEASDLALVLVTDHPSLLEAQKVFDFLDELRRPRDRARILLSLVDLRVKYSEGDNRDILAYLVSEIRRRGYPFFESFVSRSPRIAALHTHPNGRVRSILHAAQRSLVHCQMRHVAEDVLTALEKSDPRCHTVAPPRSLLDTVESILSDDCEELR
jgi:cellulose biosynthesis protein BcsQ